MASLPRVIELHGARGEAIYCEREIYRPVMYVAQLRRTTVYWEFFDKRRMLFKEWADDHGLDFIAASGCIITENGSKIVEDGTPFWAVGFGKFSHATMFMLRWSDEG